VWARMYILFRRNVTFIFLKKNTYHSHCSLEFPCTLLASTQLETESPFPAATTARSPHRLPNLTQLSYPSGPYRRHEVTFGTTSLHAPIMACLPGPAPSRHAARRESNGKENTRAARPPGRWMTQCSRAPTPTRLGYGKYVSTLE